MSRPMTLSEMRAEVYVRLAEQAGFYTDASINQWLNDGVDDTSLRLEPLVVSATIDTVADQFEYLLPEDLISIKTVLAKDSNSNWCNMELTSYEELFRDNPNWESSSTAGPPTHWYWRQDVVGIYPVPSAGVSEGLRIVYTCRPEEMDADGDTTGIPSYLDRVVVMYAVMRARAKDRDEQRSLVARTEWETSVRDASIIINKHRKEHAPRVEPKQKGYREYWYGRYPRFRAWTGDN